MLGDFGSSNGPGVANCQLRMNLKTFSSGRFQYVYAKESRLFWRIWEIICNVRKCDVIFIANYTRLHLAAVFLADKWNKPVIYRLHGYQTLESQINNQTVSRRKLRRIHRLEQYIFKHMSIGICVSKFFRDYMKKQEPEYRNKFDYCYNSMDLTGIQKKALQGKKKIKENRYRIISAGGGMRQKNNWIAAKAVQKLAEQGMDIQYCVAGAAYTDKEMICSYPFVRYYDYIPHEKMLKMMRCSDLYIQNSQFETFGLAAVEALLSGCSVLLSEHMGVLEILDNLQEEDVIKSVQDVSEISEKMKYLLQNPNRERISEGLCREKVSGMQIVDRLEDIIEKVLG